MNRCKDPTKQPVFHGGKSFFFVSLRCSNREGFSLQTYRESTLLILWVDPERHPTKWACFFLMDPVAVRGLKTSPYCPLKGDHPFGNLYTSFKNHVQHIDSILSYVFSSTSWEFRWFHQVFSPTFVDRKMVWLHHPDKGGDPERSLAAECSGWVQMF